MKKHVQSLFILGSETAWVYYTIYLFTSAEWNRPATFPATGLLLAVLLSYTLNHLLQLRVSRGSQLQIFAVNALVVAMLLSYHWTTILAGGTLGLRIAVSIGIAGIYLRSVNVILQEPKRRDALLHFEMNLLAYTLFAAVFSYNQWIDDWFHLIFISAVIASLLSMVIILHQDKGEEEKNTVRTVAAGNPGWFLWSISMLFLMIPLATAFFLIPGVSQSFRTGSLTLWRLITGLGSTVFSFLFWLLSLIPLREREGFLEEPVLEGPEQSQLVETVMVNPPIVEMILGLIFIALLATLWFLSRYISLKTLPNRRHHRSVFSESMSLWRRVKAFFIRSLEQLLRRIRLKFSSSYRHPVYWYFHQAQEWGRKNKCPRKPWETSTEYLHRLSSALPESLEASILEKTDFSLKETLAQLGEDFQRIYYGGQEASGDMSCQQYEAVMKEFE